MNLESLPVGTPMRRLADVVVFSKGKEPVLVVEIDAARGTTPASAAQFRKTLVENGLVENTPFMLIATRTTMFLWRRDTRLGDEADFAVPIKPVLQRYLKTPHDELRLSESIEILVHGWLQDLAIGIRTPDTAVAPDKMLLDSGLYELMHFGYVRFEMPA